MILMSYAQLRFYAELNDFLPPHRRQITFTHEFSGQVSVKDLVESLGIPHTEIDLILVNGASVDFGYRVKDNDRVSVYPVFESMDIRSLLRLRPEPLRETKFVLDIHLGRLAAYLRMLGFDTVYRNDSPDEKLAQVSALEARVLLTRDRGLLKRSIVTHGYWIRSTSPRLQLLEVLRRFDLFSSVRAFQRCMKCNGVLKRVAKETVAHRLPSSTRQSQKQFQCCPECHRIYWKGSHYHRMTRLLEGLMAT